jgi:dihydroflavonol-4-reductase
VVPSDPVLVTGGSGFVGRGVVERLIDDGRSVRALARSDAVAKDLTELGATPIRGDVLDGTSLRSAAAGCTTVFHVAGVNATCARKPRHMIETNVNGSANVIRAAAAEGVKRVVHTSSAATIGEPAGAIGRESTPHRGWYLSNYERSKHLAERAVFRLGEETGVEVVCVNPSSVQGPGRSTGSARLIINVAAGKLPLLIDSVVSIVDVSDCARGHVLAESNGEPGERYILNGATIGARDAVALVDRLWGLPRRVRWIPPFAARAVAAAMDAAGWALRRDMPFCGEAVRVVLQGHRYDGLRAERELGLRYTPLQETLERTLSWYAARGLVPPSSKRDESLSS